VSTVLQVRASSQLVLLQFCLQTKVFPQAFFSPKMISAASMITLSHVQPTPSPRLSRALKVQFFAQIFPGVTICFHSCIPSMLNPQIYSQVPPNSAAGTEDPAASHIREFQLALDSYLRKSVDTFNLERNCEEVLNQICSTLFDYPMIRNCGELVKYINNCVTTAWGLSTQNPTYTIEYEEREFKPDMHVKFHSSDTNGTTVRTYIWPALREGDIGPVVHKAVVIT